MGYEESPNALQLYVFDLCMYIVYFLFALVIFLLVSKKDLFLFLVALVNLIYWGQDLIDFFLYLNKGYINIKDYIFLFLSITLIGIVVRTWKTRKSGKTEIVTVTNLALLKWFIPKTEAEQALKNSQRNIELEQKLLRSQMNPHFIFNSLNSIQNYIYNQNPELAASYLSKFAKLMRLILENSREEFISFRKEIETLELYFELQKVRFGNKFDYQIHLDPLIDPDEISVPPMFAQPFIENSLEHGILHKSDRGQIQVRFILKDDYILFEVEDNGIGREKSAKINEALKSDHTSYATKITEERLSLIFDGKPPNEKVSIVDVLDENKEVAGTKAVFYIPYSRQF